MPLSSAENTGHVHIKVQEQDDSVALTVSDGPGIDPQVQPTYLTSLPSSSYKKLER